MSNEPKHTPGPMSNNDGGPAFPTENARQTGPNSWHYEGMTTRQYYKAQIATGLVSANGKRWAEDFNNDPYVLSEISAFVSAFADALIAEDEEFCGRSEE